MLLHSQSFTVHKRYALRISRGTTAESTNVWVRIEQDGIEGWGEASPFGGGKTPQTTADILAALDRITPQLATIAPWERQAIDDMLHQADLPSAARAAIDTALHDWMGKRAGLPLWQLWGFDRTRIPITSVTIGISPPKAACDRLQAWYDVIDPQAIKVKLGSPDGIEADKAMLTALLDIIPDNALVYVDANAGWTLDTAIAASHWLADRGIRYIEQPLAPDDTDGLKQLHRASPLPIFVDESCWNSRDLPHLAGCVSGINIKLMKCGGLSDALQTLYAARTWGLQTMLGCYSDSALANTAAAQLSPLVDYVDLDSHLNLTDDPFTGAQMHRGRIVPNDLPGLGVTQRADITG